MKQTCKKWWQALLEFLEENPKLAKFLVITLCVGFLCAVFFISLGLAINLAGGQSIIETIKNFILK